MEAIGVLLMSPVDTYLEQELHKRFNLFRYWIQAQKREFLSQHAASIRAVVGNSAHPELIDALPKLEIISSFGVGLDNIDLIKCQERGIRVTITNTPNVLPDDLADLAIGLMLAVLRRICVCDQFVRGGGWKFGDFKLTTRNTDLLFFSRPFEIDIYALYLVRLTGKRVGIIGLGRIGLDIAKRVEAFDCPVSYHTRSKNPDTLYTHYSSMVQLASKCDILVVACPLTPDAMHIINREVINALGPKGVLINVGTRAHVDEPELVSALEEGRLGGAGLNVFENEPQVPHRLFGIDKVVLLPHVGGGNVMTHQDMAELVLGDLEAQFNKKP